jgi:hypothetical protein
METRVATALLGIAVLASFPGSARAGSLILDDFTTGAYSKRLHCGERSAFRNGTMVGGVRNTFFSVPCDVGANAFDQTASLEIMKDGPLAFGAEIRVFHRVEVIYGIDHGNVFTPLNLDLTGFDRLRVKFDSNDLGLNFNVVVLMHDGTSLVQAACNLDPGSVPFNVDLRFKEDFLTQAGTPDWSDVDLIDVIFQSGSAIGANDYAVTAFSATDEVDPGAHFCDDLAPAP